MPIRYGRKRRTRAVGAMGSDSRSVLDSLLSHAEVLPRPDQQRRLHILLSLDSLVGECFIRSVPLFLQRITTRHLLFPADVLDDAKQLIDTLREHRRKLATAESCTGGLVAGAITAIPGSSDVFFGRLRHLCRHAKTQMIDVDADLIEHHGAVSEAVAHAMAEGAVRTTGADIAVALPVSPDPVEAVRTSLSGWFTSASCVFDGPRVERHMFGEAGRDEVRLASLRAALRLLRRGGQMSGMSGKPTGIIKAAFRSCSPSRQFLQFCSSPAFAADLTARDMSILLFHAAPGSHPALSNRNLTRLDLAGLDFKKADLRQSNFFGADLSGANLSGADLRGAGSTGSL